MALTYDPAARKWNATQEKTDYPTNLQTDLPYSEQLPVWVKTGTRTYTIKDRTETAPDIKDVAVSPTIPGPEWTRANGTLPINYTEKDLDNLTVSFNYNYYGNQVPVTLALPKDEVATKAYSLGRTYLNNKQRNELNQKTNQENEEQNIKNTNKNNAYNTVLATANSTSGGDYTTQREQIRKLQGIDDTTKQRLEDYYKIFYRTEKLQPWDERLGAKPPYGDFDYKYYEKENPEVAQKWREAEANDDIDITEQYSKPGFYLQHYTNQGRQAGKRANAKEETTRANAYTEKALTDFEKAEIRDAILGIPEGSDVPVFDDGKISALEDVVTQAVGEQSLNEVKKFGALAQNVLKDTIEEMKKAKQKEQMLSLISGFGSFGEIANINKDISNMILGDSGVGGILSFAGGNKAQESLEKNLQGISGINNNVTYNWQQWFDKTLKEKYSKDIELGYSTDQAKELVQVDSKFAKDFIEKYLNPRFNASKSIAEFIEYMDVKDKEQNPFQTQTVLNALQLTASKQAEALLKQVDKESTENRLFDPEYYFNPDPNQNSKAELQSKEVNDAWEKAKKGDEYWLAQAYRFGIDVNDKAQFAKMHFEVKGQGVGFDPAKDYTRPADVRNEVITKILPILQREAGEKGNTFIGGQFITPEEFADNMIEGLDPTDKTTWKDALKAAGLKDFEGSLAEFRDYVSETLRTNSALEVRQQIKYLNEKGEKPTQEKLGVEYIERPEDYKQDQIKGETQLYKTFQKAGYKGTEDEFYTKFFPDTDRTEQQLLTKAGTSTNLELKGLDFSDPFASLSTVQGFFEDEDQDSTDSSSEKESDIFGLGLDDDDSTQYKSKTGSQILGEFTSMFKGF